ncbi:MAG: HNH endonuclease [Rhizobiales bacterium]|nr:HNH endonuclease [Hyphomicrobiales bacterium]
MAREVAPMATDRIQALYNTKQWRARRRHQLATAPFCCMCLNEGRAVPATIADHKIPHHGDFNAFFFGELQSLCKLHHDSAKQRAEFRGYDPQIGVDGYPVDPQHPVNKQ